MILKKEFYNHKNKHLDNMFKLNLESEIQHLNNEFKLIQKEINFKGNSQVYVAEQLVKNNLIKQIDNCFVVDTPNTNKRVLVELINNKLKCNCSLSGNCVHIMAVCLKLKLPIIHNGSDYDFIKIKQVDKLKYVRPGKKGCDEIELKQTNETKSKRKSIENCKNTNSIDKVSLNESTDSNLSISKSINDVSINKSTNSISSTSILTNNDTFNKFKNNNSEFIDKRMQHLTTISFQIKNKNYLTCDILDTFCSKIEAKCNNDKFLYFPNLFTESESNSLSFLKANLSSKTINVLFILNSLAKKEG